MRFHIQIGRRSNTLGRQGFNEYTERGEHGGPPSMEERGEQALMNIPLFVMSRGMVAFILYDSKPGVGAPGYN